ncbi:MAG: glycine cleavage system aminomethyltransferase GcvT [Cryobacterium sp.]|nr:glycine cleavage system aminomethyltransferase GcvT [Cryobacterium sp.]
MSAPETTQYRTPLHEIHERAGAQFTDFAGWQMPVSYGSDLQEHHAVRTAAGIFDISHMAEIEVAGLHAAEFLDYALAGKLSAIAIGQAKYSLLLNESAGILDDLIVYRQDDEKFLVVANAGNHDVALAELQNRAKDFDVQVTDLSFETALIAVQGPNALEVLQATAELQAMDAATPIADLKYYRFSYATLHGAKVLVARTGYTGEDGFELYLPVALAPALWEALINAGGAFGLIPAGLAARDTLRLEAGMPLYGHELKADVLPEQVGLGKVVSLAKEGDFVGRSAAEKELNPQARKLVGLSSEGRRAGRAGYQLFVGTKEIGEITSGALSPTLGHPIAMAMVDPAFQTEGTEIEIDVRGTRIPAKVVPLPFYKREKN